MNYREKMRKAIECPQFGNIDYGEWGTLNLNQRKDIKRLLDEMDRADEVIKNQFFKIDRLNNIISETSKDIQHELSHLKANDEVSWNEEFYTNNKLDYRKLCIALLEQVVNKLKEKE